MSPPLQQHPGAAVKDEFVGSPAKLGATHHPRSASVWAAELPKHLKRNMERLSGYPASHFEDLMIFSLGGEILKEK